MKTLLLFCLIGISTTLFSQDRFFKMDGTFGGAFTNGKTKSAGISAGIEPKYFFNPQVSLGLRLEGAALFGGKIDMTGEGGTKVTESARTAQLIKAEYYLSDADNRLFFGLMAGRYTQANIGATDAGSASVEAVNSFGFAPEIGVTFKNFRLSAIYHMIPGKSLVSINVFDAINVSKNYFVIQMGWKLFQID